MAIREGRNASAPRLGDWPRAVQLFQRACKAFSANGCVQLGLAYEKGEGVPADPEKAKDPYKRACCFVFPNKYACDRLKALGS